MFACTFSSAETFSSGLCTVQCTTHTAYCTVHTAQYTVHFTVYPVCTGREPLFTNWDEGQPDNRGHWFRQEDCAYIQETNMKWNDWDCNNGKTPWVGWSLNDLCEKTAWNRAWKK